MAPIAEQIKTLAAKACRHPGTFIKFQKCRMSLISLATRWVSPWKRNARMRRGLSFAACISWLSQPNSQPEKTVLLPNLSAGCALADSITPESLEEWMDRYPGYAVVTYVNSSAEIKAMSDICCTSANAVSVIRSLDTDKILFVPDRNLGNWVKKQVPDKDVAV